MPGESRLKELMHNREIRLIEYSTERNWYQEIPTENWLCVLVVNNKPRRYIEEVISKIIDKDGCYFCAIGNQGKEAHDLMDEEIAYREAEIEQLYVPKHSIITTWDNELEEGIWFAIFAAHHEIVEIKKVIILDMTDGKETRRIQSALLKIRNEN